MVVRLRICYINRVSNAKYDHIDVEEITRLYTTGLTTPEIARRLDVPSNAVAYRLRVAGVVRRPRGTRSGLTPAQRTEAVVRLYHEGRTVLEMVRSLRISTAAIATVLSEQRLPQRVKRRLLSFDQCAAVAVAYKDGATYAELCLRYNVSASVIQSALSEHGVKPRRGWAKYRVTRWTDRQGRVFLFKSTWERAYAAHLDSLGLVWDYEPKTFRFHTDLKHRGYTPDFRVVRPEGEVFVEIHGWDDVPTRTRMALFRAEYPAVAFDLLGPAEMVSLGLIESVFAEHPQAQRISALRTRFRFQQITST